MRAAIVFCITSNFILQMVFFFGYRCVCLRYAFVCVRVKFPKSEREREREREGESESTVLERIEVKDSQIRFASNVPRTS